MWGAATISPRSGAQRRTGRCSSVYRAAMSTATSQTPLEFHSEMRRRARWRLWSRAAVIAVGVAVVVMLTVWTNWMVQRYVILGDDTARGERLREYLTATATGTAAQRDEYIADQCWLAAGAFYGHEIGAAPRGSRYADFRDIDFPGQGAAPPSEKAFFHACSGWVGGGRGGGGSGD
jgi:hypothetical protein